MNCNPIPEREDWFITDRKPTICPRCKKKEVKKSVFGMPSREDYYEAKYHFKVVLLTFPSLELGAAVIVTLPFIKILKEIGLLLVV